MTLIELLIQIPLVQAYNERPSSTDDNMSSITPLCEPDQSNARL